MFNRKTAALAGLALSATALAMFSAHAQFVSGADKIKFPENFDKGVLYTTLDRADNKQFREIYTSVAAVEAARKGEPLPSGTVITLVQYKARLDAQGVPEKDAAGRFVKGDLLAYTVMEKQTGWGSQYPAELRNGEWEYQAFRADKSANDKANIKGCFECHKPLEAGKDFVFSYDRMAGK